MPKYNNAQPALSKAEGDNQFTVQNSHPENLRTLADALGGTVNGNNVI